MNNYLAHKSILMINSCNFGEIPTTGSKDIMGKVKSLHT